MGPFYPREITGPAPIAPGSAVKSQVRHMIRMRRIVAAVCLIAVASLGCNSDGGTPAPTRASVRGLVTWEGEPIEEGTITFTPVGDTKGSPTAASILDGAYTLNSTMGPSVGPNKVQIIGMRSTGKTIKAVPPASGDIPQTEQYIPPKFNRSSTLEREIESGDNKYDFELTAK